MNFPTTHTTPAELATSNPHTDRHTDFNNARLFERLQEKHRPKPYWQQWRRLYFAVLAVSFLIHALSAATAAALVFFFLQNLTGSNAAAGLMTAAGLAALEFTKRETGGKLFHGWLQFRSAPPGLIVSVFALAAISTAASYYGAEKTVTSWTPPPVTVNTDSAAAPIRAQIAALDEQIRQANQTTYKGTVTPRAQRTVERLSRAKEALLAEQVRTAERLDARNDATELQHHTTTTATAQGFALFTLIAELALIACLFYLQYYDFRSFAEYAHATTGTSPTNSRQPEKHAAGLKVQTTIPTTPPGAEQYNHQPGRIGFIYGNSGSNSGSTQNVTSANLQRECEHCKATYTHGHARQRYCCDLCRVEAWQSRTGKRVRKNGVTAT